MGQTEVGVNVVGQMEKLRDAAQLDGHLAPRDLSLD